MTTRAATLWLMATLLAFAPARSPARADDAAEARFFDALGRRAYERRRWDEALSAFLAAERAAPSARTLYNVALAAQLAHRDALAFSSFEGYLAHADADDPQRRESARTRRDALARTLALARVTSDPPGAEIWVDRRELGSFGRAPRTLVLEPGAHTIELTQPDHEPVHLEVVAVRARQLTIAGTLSPVLGGLRIDVSPPTANVRLTRHGEERGVPAGQEVVVPVGAWTLHAAADGHVERSIDLNVTRDHVERRTISLVRIPTPTARLLISTGAVHARLSVDGVVRAETPARLDDLRVGTRRLRLVADGFVAWERSLDLTSLRATQLNVTLVPVR